ncbi:MAG TPA: S-adenosylmethionine:tRNA ribosyltransferase-isomerase [Gemmataceae bacterium]|nr:S-adenosylmethionine:tRNA ribosyltransferase-isomerase [Gemmataceae bacterium]
MSAPFAFALPPELAAKEPPERRGLARDGVRLLVIDRRTHQVEHTRFSRIGDFLRAGDLLVFNSSRTLPAALPGRVAGGPAIEVRLAERLPDDSWLALLVCGGDSPFGCGLRAGLEVEFDLGLSATVLNRDPRIPRLWRVRFSSSGAEFIDLVHRLGRPVRYEYIGRPWALDEYQTVFAREPGSAEMPSAGRAFTWRLLFDLRNRGIETAQVVLHTGLSSYLDDALDAAHPTSEEEFAVPAEAADAVNRARAGGRRVIAVGTTVVRTLESVANGDGVVRAVRGYTRLRVTAQHRLKAVDGLLSGLHEPEASHLDLLTAFLPAEVVRAAYEDAVRRGYLWHEFGDLNLIV